MHLCLKIIFRKSEQRLRDKEDTIAHMWDRLETM